MAAIDKGLIEWLTDCLTDRTIAQPAHNFPTDPAAVDGPGLYSWWADDDGLTTLSEPLGVALPPLIYVGQTGATSRRAGIERVATLRSRIGTNHLNGNVSSSTFRKTLSAILFSPLQLCLSSKNRLDKPSNEAVSRWMRCHLWVTAVKVEDRATLAEVEEEILARLDPPLNLMGMPATPVRSQLRMLRQRLSA
jgi:hypothetical protein